MSKNFSRDCRRYGRDWFKTGRIDFFVFLRSERIFFFRVRKDIDSKSVFLMIFSVNLKRGQVPLRSKVWPPFVKKLFFP